MSSDLLAIYSSDNDLSLQAQKSIQRSRALSQCAVRLGIWRGKLTMACWL